MSKPVVECYGNLIDVRVSECEAFDGLENQAVALAVEVVRTDLL